MNLTQVLFFSNGVTMAEKLIFWIFLSAGMKKLLAKPLKALASPGIYLFGKYNQYKRERQETNLPLTPTENELSQLNSKIVSISCRFFFETILS
jgi:hypothetical protein